MSYANCLKNSIIIGQLEVPMKIARLVREQVEKMPIGEPFTAAAFLSLGKRATVYKALGRLAQAGVIMRVTHGIFARAEVSKYGTVPPELLKVVKAKANGASVEVHGAEAARRFGLSTQVPVRPVFYTTGPTKSFIFGGLPVTLRHVSSRKIVSPGTNVGLAVSALWYLGQGQVGPAVFEAIKKRLTHGEYEQLRELSSVMPAWMAESFFSYEEQANHV